MPLAGSSGSPGHHAPRPGGLIGKLRRDAINFTRPFRDRNAQATAQHGILASKNSPRRAASLRARQAPHARRVCARHLRVAAQSPVLSEPGRSQRARRACRADWPARAEPSRSRTIPRGKRFDPPRASGIEQAALTARVHGCGASMSLLSAQSHFAKPIRGTCHPLAKSQSAPARSAMSAASPALTGISASATFRLARVARVTLHRRPGQC
jgi:hypothetical protein